MKNRINGGGMGRNGKLPRIPAGGRVLDLNRPTDEAVAFVTVQKFHATLKAAREDVRELLSTIDEGELDGEIVEGLRAYQNAIDGRISALKPFRVVATLGVTKEQLERFNKGFENVQKLFSIGDEPSGAPPAEPTT